MLAWVGAIGSVLTNVFTLLKDYLANKKEEAKQAYNERMAEQRARQELAKERLREEYKTSQLQLTVTGKWFKYISFWGWFGPFFSTYLTPDYAQRIFENMNVLPPWYAQSCMLLMFAVWGITTSAPHIVPIFESVGKWFEDRRKKKFNLKLAVKTLESVKGHISDQELDLFVKALQAGGMMSERINEDENDKDA